MFGTAAAPCGQRGFFTRAIPTLALGLALAASPSFAQSTKTAPQTQGTTTAAAAVEREGELEVLHVHNADKTSGYRYFLRSEKGRVELKFKKRGPRQPSGTKVRVKGSLSGNVLALDSTGGTSYQVLALAAPNTFGAQSTAVLLINFQDNQTQPYTASQINTTVFGESSNFIKENSAQQTSLSGNVFGWYTLPMAQTCDYLAIRDAALQMATANGVNLSLYSRHILVMPTLSSCAWSGLGTVGGSPSTTWLNGAVTRKGVTHEMGHNLGLWHSHFLDCDATALGNTCTKSEYGDVVDTMGSGLFGHFNAFQKERLGWLNYGVSPPVATVESGGGTFTLEPYAAASNGTKALKVLKGVDATTGQKSWYYVEYRQPIGFDAPLAPNSGLINGVLVHMGTDSQGDSSSLLDMTPNSSLYLDAFDASLAVGKSYVDSNSGVTISLLSASSSGATVSVSMNGQTQTPTQTCTHANPGIAISPGQSASVAPGSAVTYTLSVTNADSSVCSSSVFNLAATVPAGWSRTLASPSLTLAPGASASTTLTVASPTTAAAGSYGISVTAANGTTSGYSASTSATYTVASATTTTTATNKPPVAVNDNASTLSGTAVKIAVLANDSDPEGKPLSLKSVGAPSRGKVVINSDGTVSYTPNGKFKGSDSFSYTVSDGVNPASASVAVQVTR